MRIFTVFLIIAFLAGCNPLRRIQRNQHTDSTAVDRSEVRKTVTDIAKEHGTLVQTVIEYYPPAAVLETSAGRDSNLRPLSGLEPSATIPAGITTPAPAVKRIICTEITAAREQATTTDSAAHNNIAVAVKSEFHDKIIEKPPAGVLSLKWIAACLAALLLILIAIRKYIL